MRRFAVALCLVITGFAVLSPGAASAAGPGAMTLPVGTKVQELGPGQFKLLLPDGQAVEVRSFNAANMVIGDCGLLDRTGKRTLGGARAVLRGAPASKAAPGKPPGGAAQIDDEVTWNKLRGGPAPKAGVGKPPGGAAQIDDEVTWIKLGGVAVRLPAVIEIVDVPAPVRGLSPQPDPPGKR